MTPDKVEWFYPCPECGSVVLSWSYDPAEAIFLDCTSDTCDFEDAI